MSGHRDSRLPVLCDMGTCEAGHSQCALGQMSGAGEESQAPWVFPKKRDLGDGGKLGEV